MTKTLKDKTLLLLCRSSVYNFDAYAKNIIPTLKKIFKEVIIFDTKINYFKFGKEAMNKNILEILENIKPDYALFDLAYDEFKLETLEKLKEISPKTINIVLFGDDNWRFDDYSRYYSLFFDFIIVSEKDDSYYRKDGIKNTFFVAGANVSAYKPLNLEKIYDVSFIGGPINDRPDFIKFLIDNDIKVALFGEGWSKYPEFKNVWKGFLSLEDMVKAINQSKINLNFSKSFFNVKNNTQLKGRVFEVLACNSFLLTEYFEDAENYLDDIDKISFRTKEELLKKIRHYLKDEKSRNSLTRKLFKKVLSEYSWENNLVGIFDKISNKGIIKHKPFPYIKKKFVYISKEDLMGGDEKVFEKIKNYDYIFLKTGNIEVSPLRDFFQAYALEKSNKEISCCDYYVATPSLGAYLLFMAKRSFYFLKNNDFCRLLDINQIAVTRDCFNKNIGKFKNYINGEPIDIISRENTVFISIPLISLKKYDKKFDYQIMKDAFRMRFLDDLFSLVYQKKVFFSPYAYKLSLHGFFRERFILKHIFLSLIDSWNWEKLKTSL